MRATLALAIALVAGPACAQAAQQAEKAPFFKGKTINMIINFSAGGPTDTEGRLVARHLAQHIPGSPTIVVQNVTGAGGAIGVNYVGRIAQNNGLTFGYTSGIAFDAALQYRSLQVDLAKMPLIAAGPDVTVVYCRSDYGGGVKKPADLLSKSGFWVAGLSPDSNKDVRLRMEMDLLGLKYHYMTGFPGAADVRLAVQRGEAQVTSESMPSYRASIEPLVEKGDLTPLWYDIGENDAAGAKEAAGIPATSFLAFYKKHGDGQTNSALYRSYVVANEIGADFLRLVIMRQGAPPEAVATLQKAFAALSNDPAYIRDAMKTIRYVPTFSQGEQMQRAFVTALRPDPAVVTFLKNYIKQGESRR